MKNILMMSVVVLALAASSAVYALDTPVEATTATTPTVQTDSHCKDATGALIPNAVYLKDYATCVQVVTDPVEVAKAVDENGNTAPVTPDTATDDPNCDTADAKANGFYMRPVTNPDTGQEGMQKMVCIFD